MPIRNGKEFKTLLLILHPIETILPLLSITETMSLPHRIEIQNSSDLMYKIEQTGSNSSCFKDNVV